MMIYTIWICAVVSVAVAALIPESVRRKNSLLANLASFAWPIRFLLFWLLRNSVGRFSAPSENVKPPKLTKINSAGTEAIYVEWDESEVTWRFVSHDLEISSDEKTWKSVYSGDERDFLIENLNERTLYHIRLRRRIGGKSSSWSVLPKPVWTLANRTAAGGSTGPLVGGGEYVWSQDDNEVEVVIPLASSTRRSEVSVSFKAKSISVKVKGEVILSGEFAKEALADECFWAIANDKLTLSIAKKDRFTNWASVVSDHPPIDLF